MAYVIANKGYDFYDVRVLIVNSQKIPVIPRRSGAASPGIYDKERYKTRSAIERFFGRIKENKRLCLRFDKMDKSFFSFFALSCLTAFNILC